MALVVKKWFVSKQADEQGNYVHIIGREAGFFGWILSLMKIDPTTELEIKKNLIIFTSSSFSGKEKHITPIKSVCSTYYSYKKPWQLSVIIAVTFLPFFGIGLILGLLYYYFNKQFVVAFIENAGWVGSFAFKPSAMEGQDIDEKRASEVVSIIRALIEAKTI